MFGSLHPALDKRFMDHHFGGDIPQFESLPRFHLSSHRFEIPLHPINANRDTVDERERL